MKIRLRVQHRGVTNVVTPDWIIHTKSIFDKPTMGQLWSGIFELKQKVLTTYKLKLFVSTGINYNLNFCLVFDNDFFFLLLLLFDMNIHKDAIH